MIQLEKIVEGLEKTVILEQTVDPSYPKLQTDLVDQSVGARLCYHALIKTENIESIAPDFDNMDWPDWSAIVYPAGTTVNHLGTNWTSNMATTAGDIPGTSALWDQQERISDYLRNRRKQAVRTAIMDAYNAGRAEFKQREELDNMVMFDGAGAMNDLIIPKGRIVGFSIELLNNLGLEMTIDQIGLQLSTVQQLDFYLWHVNQVAPIATITIDQDAAYSVKWHDTSSDSANPIQKLRFRDLENNLDSGLYFLGYYEDDLLGQAVNKFINLGTIPCGSCSRYNQTAYNKYSQYVRIKAFSVAAGVFPVNNDLWDIRKTTYNPDTNWGMNLKISSGCDITEMVLNTPQIFSDVVAEQLKVDLLTELANTTRSNDLGETVKTNAAAALGPEHIGGEGLLHRLKQSKEAAKLEIARIDANVCAPRVNPKGITNKTAGVRSGNYRGYTSGRRF